MRYIKQKKSSFLTKLVLQLNLEKLLNYQILLIKITINWKFLPIFFFCSVIILNSLIIAFNAITCCFLKDFFEIEKYN